MTGIEKLDAAALAPKEIDTAELMTAMNREFTTKLTPENGVYGVVETVKDNGTVERLCKNDFGHSIKEYYSDGRLFKSREVLGKGNIATTLFDDNGTAYLKTVSELKDNVSRIVSDELLPNATVVKGNFSSVVDAYGRPILNKITDLQLKTEGRDSIIATPDSSYRINDQRGHIIADLFGGPATRENIVAQLDKVNLGKMKQVENIVRDLKAEGHTVDYEVKVNYVGSKDARPTSFEPKITVDGKEYTEIPDDLIKIYNESDITDFQRFETTVGEKINTISEMGIKPDLFAAGIACVVSTVDNVTLFIDGEITSEELVVDIVEDTADALINNNGIEIISQTVSKAMSHSSSELIRAIGDSCVTEAVVEFGIQSFEDISDYIQGEIDASELAYNLGENAVDATGKIVGSLIGERTGIGSIVGGTIGCALASEIYQTAVETASEHADVVLDTIKDTSADVIEAVSEFVPEKVSSVIGAFNNFFKSNSIPLSI